MYNIKGIRNSISHQYQCIVLMLYIDIGVRILILLFAFKVHVYH